MRVILDTNILLSALISPHGPADQLYHAWRTGRFTLLTSDAQLDELRRVTRQVRVRPLVDSAAAGTLVNELRELALLVTDLPNIEISADPFDNFLFAMARMGRADYLVSGDLAGVVLTRASPIDLPTITWRALSAGRFRVSRHRQVHPFSGLPSLLVRSLDERPLPIQVDGDYIGAASEVEFSIIRHGLTIIA